MVQELTFQDFSQKLNSENKPIIIELGADWCSPCKALEPAFKEISEEIKNAKFYKIDVDKEPGLTKKFEVMSVPTIIIFKKGKEIARINGYPGKENLKERILSKI